MVLLMIIWLVDFFLIKQFDVTLIVTSRRQIVFSIFQFMMSLIEWEYTFLVNTDLKIKIMSNKKSNPWECPLRFQKLKNPNESNLNQPDSPPQSFGTNKDSQVLAQLKLRIVSVT